MCDYSFFHLTARALSPQDAIPGVSCDEDTFCGLVDALRETLNTLHDDYPDLTYGDVIHAAKCLASELVQDWAEDTADA